MAKSKLDKDGNARIQCKECEGWFHRLDVHLKVHSTNVKKYQSKHKGAATISDHAAAQASKAQKGSTAGIVANMPRKAQVNTDGEAKGKQFRVGVARINQRTDVVDPIDVARIPQHDDYWLPGKREKEQWECLALGLQLNEPVFIFGPTGCGKTTLVKELAAACTQPCLRINMNKDWDNDMLVGTKELIETAEGNTITSFSPGVLTKAMQRGWWLLIDEMDAAPADVLLTLQGVLEGDALVLESGEVIKPHTHFRIIATGNTNGRGDETGLYVGTHVLNEATLDRFGVVIKADYPEKETEIQILTGRTGISEDKARKMVECAQKVREAFENEACYCTFSTRRLISWAAKAMILGDVRRASQIAVINKLSGDDAKFVDGITQRYFGGDV